MPCALHGLLYLLTIYIVSKSVENCGKQNWSRPEFLGDGMPGRKIYSSNLCP